MKTTLMISAAGAAILAATPAFAQQVDTIYVEAERRSANIQDVPIAVSAFDADSLDKKQISEPLDIVDYVPNFFGGNNTGLGSANSYFIRGLGNVESIATFDPAVGTYVDEVYIARQNGNNVSLFDVEQLEVLRGPQGTLFGRNTTGGAVVIRMKKPAEEYGGYAEIGYGSFDRYFGRAGVDIPLSENVLTKISGFYLHDNGFVENTTTGERLNGQESWGVRGDLRFLLGERATWDISADYTFDDGMNLLNTVAGGSVFAKPASGGPRVAATGLRRSCSGQGTLPEQRNNGECLGATNKSFSINTNLAIDVGGGTLNLIAGYRALDQEFILDFFNGTAPQGLFVITNDGEHNQFSVELKYSASYFDGRVDLVSGVFYFTEDNTTDFQDFFGSLNPFADRIAENDLSSIAIYSQADIALTDRLTFTAGARWTEEDKDFAIVDRLSPPPGTALSLNTANLAAFGIPTHLVRALITPRFALQYDLTEDANVFASATKGFKSGGWNAREAIASRLTEFVREAVWSYEAGVRSQLFDDRVRFNLTGFFLDVADAQIISGVATATGIRFLTDNFGDLESYGLEIDSEIAVTDGLRVFGSLGLLESTYKNIDPSILAQQAACLNALAMMLPTTNLCASGIVTPTGGISEPVRTPEVTASVGGYYDIPLSSAGVTLTPTFNLRYNGSMFVGTNNSPASFEDGFTTINAGLSLRHDDSGLTLTAECNNCTNVVYTTANLAGTVYLNEPRRWGVRVKGAF